MASTYARLGTSAEEDKSPSLHLHHSQPNYYQQQQQHHHRPVQRTLLLVLLLLLSFIIIFTLTLLLSLLLGDVRHQRSDLLLFESSVFEEDQLPFSSSSSELSPLYISGQPDEGSSQWSAIEAGLAKFDRGSIEALPADLLNLRNFTFSSTAEQTLKRCRSMKLTAPAASLNLVILIHSAVGHFAHRQRLRRSWLALDESLVPPGASIAHAFILGGGQQQRTNSLKDQQQMMSAALSVERRLYGDIVQAEGFIDSYRNLTYKHLAGLRWSVQYGCAPVADYLLKVDDDAFVDMYAVLRYLAEGKAKHSSSPASDLMCSLFPAGTAPKRTTGSKWSLDYSTYPFPVFPAYCSGVGYLLRPQLARELLAASSKWQADHPLPQPVIPIDDVFVTGLLRTTLRPPVKAVAINSQYVYDVRKLRRWLKGDDDDDGGGDCPSGYLFGDIGNELDAASLMAKLWSKTERAWRRHQAADQPGGRECPQSTSVVRVSSL